MISRLVEDAEPLLIPKAEYPKSTPVPFSEAYRTILQAHPGWLSLSSLDALYEHDRRTCIIERGVLNLIASNAGRREERQAALVSAPAFEEAYMHVRQEQPAPKVEAARYAPKLEQAMVTSPPCTTAAVLTIWESYPELHAAEALSPNPILALRATQAQFRTACEFVAKKMAAGQAIKRPVGMVHGTLKAMVVRR